jgi:hypothetical protein
LNQLKSQSLSDPLTSQHAVTAIGALCFKGFDQSFWVQGQRTRTNAWFRLRLTAAPFVIVANFETKRIDQLGEYERNRLNTEIAAPQAILREKLEQ